MQITLRNVNQDDLPIFYEQQLDMEATQMAAFPSREKDAFMTHWATKVLANETGMVKTILFEDQVAGNILSYEMEGHREIGYWLGRGFWSKGIASESLKQFLG
jgi:RimJ/RimL family protein N-acetyltransferase